MSKATVSLEEGSATVTGTATTEALIAAVNKTGKIASLWSEGNSGSSAEEVVLVGKPVHRKRPSPRSLRGKRVKERKERILILI